MLLNKQEIIYIVIQELVVQNVPKLGAKIIVLIHFIKTHHRNFGHKIAKHAGIVVFTQKIKNK